MGLINLKTDLKSLRFGNDRIGGGNSGQPYITTNIPDEISPYIGTTDFLLRGGINAVTDSLEDVKRLGKMFVDTKSPNGLLFIAKQQLLSRTSVRTQTSGVLNEGIYSPLNTLAQAGVSAFGLHLNKQGVNPFADTGAYSNNRFLYGVRVKSTQPSLDNRLVKLYNAITNVTIGEDNGIKLNNGINVMTYTGGPGSILGVGNTGIRYVDDINRTGLYNYQAKSPNLKPYFDGTYKPVFTPNNYLKNLFDVTLNKGAFGKYSRLIGLSQILYDVLQPYNTEGKLTGVYNHNVYEPTVEGNTWPKNSPLIYNNDTFTYTQEDIIQTNINPPNGVNLSPKTQDFRKVLREKLGTFKPNTRTSEESGATSLAPSYNIADNKTIEGRTNLGDPGARAGKSYANYTNGIPYPQINISTPGLVGSAPTGLDKINSIPLYRSKEVAQDSQVNDLVKFRIAVIDNNNPNFKTFVHFRAFIDSMNDSYTGDWSSFQYIGRGEKFYTYNGFSRQISLSWTVAAQSKQELIPMYKKLNYLASTLAPNYSSQGYMRGVFCQLTVGGYLYEQPGFITSLTYDVPTDSPWEIGINTDGGSDSSVKELPHIIKVSSFNFTPIHRFIPEKQKNLYGTDGDSFVSTYGDQKYIALTNGFTDNYND